MYRTASISDNDGKIVTLSYWDIFFVCFWFAEKSCVRMWPHIDSYSIEMVSSIFGWNLWHCMPRILNLWILICLEGINAGQVPLASVIMQHYIKKGVPTLVCRPNLECIFLCWSKEIHWEGWYLKNASGTQLLMKYEQEMESCRGEAGKFDCDCLSVYISINERERQRETERQRD